MVHCIIETMLLLQLYARLAVLENFYFFLCNLFFFCFCGKICIKDKEIYGPIIIKIKHRFRNKNVKGF